jgi:predicted nucleotidyltransferase
MRENILYELEKVERVHGVRILYACEAGSRVWGFHSPNSDYDVRFIYAHPLSHYLSILERRDVIEVPITGLLDINGWDIRKALQLLNKSNPSLLEWLGSPIVYREDPVETQKMQELARDYFNSRAVLYHYLSMANGNYRSYLQEDQVQLKKYLYVVRPLLACMWVEKNQSLPPVEMAQLMTLMDDPETFFEVTKLVIRKMAGDELAMGPRLDVINRWAEGKLNHFATFSRTATVGKTKSGDLDAFFLSVLYGEIP